MLIDRDPTVTEVLSAFTDFSMIPPGVLEKAAARGTEVHSLCYGIAKGMWLPSIPPDCAGFVLSFQDFFNKYVKKTIFAEGELVDKIFGFLGHPDLIVEFYDGANVLIDLKTPLNLQKTWKGQMAAYKHLAEQNGFKIDRVGSLRLSPKGNPPKFDQYTNSAIDLTAFLAALSAYKHYK